MNKMNTKKLTVSFLVFVSVFALIATVSAVASTSQLGTISTVQVDQVNVNNNPAIVAGDNVNVRVDFASLVNTSDVTVKVTIEGNKGDSVVQTVPFDVEQGQTYTKTLQVTVPSDLKDVLSDYTTLDVEIKGANGYKTQTSYDLRVQRQAYDANIMSVNVPQIIKAGDNFPVDIVIKNQGYNNLNDVYVTASIPALGLGQTAYLGDIVALECNKDANSVQNYGVNITRKCNENNQDTLNGRLYIQLPYNVKAGVYELDVKVQNGDTVTSGTVQVAIQNAYSSGNFIVSGNQLLIVNPTNQVQVYRLVPDAANTFGLTMSDNLVAVPAGSSRTVTVDPASSVSGAQTYTVDAFASDGTLAGTVNFSTTGATQTSSTTSPIAVLTIILAIIFVVLLVVLFVLVGKKPEKADEFGESYY